MCKEDCHFKVEQFHINEGESWEEGLHPDDLYKKNKQFERASNTEKQWTLIKKK